MPGEVGGTKVPSVLAETPSLPLPPAPVKPPIEEVAHSPLVVEKPILLVERIEQVLDPRFEWIEDLLTQVALTGAEAGLIWILIKNTVGILWLSIVLSVICLVSLIYWQVEGLGGKKLSKKFLFYIFSGTLVLAFVLAVQQPKLWTPIDIIADIHPLASLILTVIESGAIALTFVCLFLGIQYQILHQPPRN